MSACGSCGRCCSSVPNADATCTNGVCGFTCLAGFGDCDGEAVNGCETDLNASSEHCGACGNNCGTNPPHAVRVCAGGTCEFHCVGAFDDCDGIEANGCESNLEVTESNCGGCGITCPPGQQCFSGVCQ